MVTRSCLYPCLHKVRNAIASKHAFCTAVNMKPSAPSIPNHRRRRCGKSWNLEEIMLNHVRSRIVGNDGKPSGKSETRQTNENTTSTTVCQPLGWAGTSTSAKQRDDAYGNVNVSRRRRHTAPRMEEGMSEYRLVRRAGDDGEGGRRASAHMVCALICTDERARVRVDLSASIYAHTMCVCVCVSQGHARFRFILGFGPVASQIAGGKRHGHQHHIRYTGGRDSTMNYHTAG